MNIEKKLAYYVQLWVRLERTRRLLKRNCKRFCIRNVLKMWLGPRATDYFIWQVCHECDQYGWDELPEPSISPCKNREFLRALITIMDKKPKLPELDAAYLVVFPYNKASNIKQKVKKQNPLKNKDNDTKRNSK